MPDLLIELFSEEIPARMQARARADLQKLITDGLVEGGLTYASAAAFSTPRRLALTVEGLNDESPTLREERKGPRVDAPDKAIEGFLRATGLTREQLDVRDEKKGQVYFASIEKPGRPAAQIVAEVLEKTIRNFPWPKSMRWGAGSLRWVRPLHTILCILSREDGAEIVPLNIDGITAGDTTQGHRFMAAGEIRVTGFDDYAAKLKRAKVIIDQAERAETIWHDATNMAFAQGLEVVEDKGLLTEVAGLVEWPVVLMGEIGDDFLNLPPEVLQTSMKEHQKFFSVSDPKTGKILKFVTVANRETTDNGATILAGNQKVLAARLSDAKFFWENDLRVATSDTDQWVRALDNVTFHNKLGTQAARIDRIAALAAEIAPAVGAEADLAAQAARFAKADLSSEMVYEFPELQGLMGRYYAQAAGMDDAIAAAAQDHYAPLGPSDDVPTAPVSVAVALADKLDLLTGFWAIDEKPTGSKDPFALRRAALGVIRIALENGLRLKLDRFVDAQLLRHKAKLVEDVNEAEVLDLLEEIAARGVFGAAFNTLRERLDGDASNGLQAIGAELPDKSVNLLSFFHDRLKVYLRDQGLKHDVIDACLAMPGNDDLTLVVARARALAEVLATEDGENLVQGFKRANNILTQAQEKDGVEYSYGADPKFAEADEEKALFAALETSKPAIDAALEAEDFAAAMSGMAALRPAVDAFFEAVQVNADSDVLRRNRLNLLNMIREACLGVADLTRIEG
ncbi:glycyl-tRNA synthetase subunit beta [Actibacterium mucosum KCTC 23349]|uniref:Glycine--tRNA ligase beta subunit n=1 Tax=Actibacterium mucosum KCTC 23349 TaxID=1454373 RepID=A0A037ZHB9_9RHOB|nr:glycine--tRNA ligase subunit beta [Actibacterium mucosum]KAJ54215.1 glycyl-tRNA synthetase subunit beta [Actibacterium mucosum KCTC 23349]